MANPTISYTAAPFTGGKVLLILAGFFGVIFAVNFLLAYDAISTFRGEVVDNPYEVGLHYDSDIAAAAAQAQRHWKVEVTLVGGLRATFRDSAGEPIAGLTVSGLFAAPADMQRDRPFALREAEPGVYIGEAPPAGVWDLRLKAARGGQVLFQSNNRIAPR
jgi:nitrogen fixation protein FixH